MVMERQGKQSRSGIKYLSSPVIQISKEKKEKGSGEKNRAGMA
jgi:hypothetical protein